MPATVAPPTKKSTNLVKVEKVELVKPPPPTSYTPVKSPDQKRPKAAEPRRDGGLVRRSLCADMDAVGLGLMVEMVLVELVPNR